MLHELKAYPANFEPMYHGFKVHDIRRNDRDFRIEDEVRVREYTPHNCQYTGREVFGKITYITDANNHCALSPQAIGAGFAVLSIQITGRVN